MSLEQQTKELLQRVVKMDVGGAWVVPIVMLTMTIVLLFVGFSPIARLIDKASRSWFCWGDAIALHESFENRLHVIKWVIVGGFVVSLGATLLGAWLTR